MCKITRSSRSKFSSSYGIGHVGQCALFEEAEAELLEKHRVGTGLQERRLSVGGGLVDRVAGRRGGRSSRLLCVRARHDRALATDAAQVRRGVRSGAQSGARGLVNCGVHVGPDGARAAGLCATRSRFACKRAFVGGCPGLRTHSWSLNRSAHCKCRALRVTRGWLHAVEHDGCKE